MQELYWITRFNAINTLASILSFLGILLTIGFTIGYSINALEEKAQEAINQERKAKEARGYKNFSKSFLKWIIPITVFSTLITIFVPTTKEALTIYSIGGTIDYLKENPTAQKLPDKCIKALDRWIEGIEEKKDSTQNKK